MAGNLGYRTIIVSDATATFERKANENEKPVDPETIHRIHLLSLEGEFAEVLTTEDVQDLLDKK